jgi:hypothetical protein
LLFSKLSLPNFGIFFSTNKASSPPFFRNIFLGEFMSSFTVSFVDSMRKAIIYNCMFHIMCMRYIFKITRSIISFYTIFMVYFKSLWLRANKRDSNCCVDITRSDIGVKKSNSQIPTMGKGWFQYSSCLYSLSTTISSYPTKIRHRINSFPSNNGSPFFFFKFFLTKLCGIIGIRHANLLYRFVCLGCRRTIHSLAAVFVLYHNIILNTTI